MPCGLIGGEQLRAQRGEFTAHFTAHRGNGSVMEKQLSLFFCWLPPGIHTR